MVSNDFDGGWSSEEEEMVGKQNYGAIGSATFIEKNNGTGYANNVSVSFLFSSHPRSLTVSLYLERLI